MIAVIMGVSGVGKSAVGEGLARELACTFLDADAFHPPANVAKMRSGTPLTDEDRWPWLDALNARLRAAHAAGESVVLACSALKQRYRERLLAALPGARMVFLHGDRELIAQRLQARRGHYMPASLLDSQFAALEPPADAIAVDVSGSVASIVAAVRERLGQGI